MTGRESRPGFPFLLFRPSANSILSFRPSVVFSLALAQNRGFCAKEERQRSEVARHVYAACLERSLPRRARGEISERQRRTKWRAAEPRCRISPGSLRACKGEILLVKLHYLIIAHKNFCCKSSKSLLYNIFKLT